ASIAAAASLKAPRSTSPWTPWRQPILLGACNESTAASRLSGPSRPPVAHLADRPHCRRAGNDSDRRDDRRSRCGHERGDPELQGYPVRRTTCRSTALASDRKSVV